jgi:hypothetical protein
MGTTQLALATPGCDSGGGGTRPLNPLEREVIDLWNHSKLNSSDFSVGNVISVIKRLRQIIH